MNETERYLKVSRRGIFYDLSISPYVFDNGVYQLVFSSKFNLERFKDFKEAAIPDGALNRAIKGIIEITVDISAIRDIDEYHRIEKRGFMVYSYKFDRWYYELGEMKFAALEV